MTDPQGSAGASQPEGPPPTGGPPPAVAPQPGPPQGYAPAPIYGAPPAYGQPPEYAQPQTYAQPGPPPVERAPSNAPAMLSMIIALVAAFISLSILLPFWGFVLVALSLPVSGTAVILGYVGLKTAKRVGAGRANAVVGLVVGHIALLLSAGSGIYLVIVYMSLVIGTTGGF